MSEEDFGEVRSRPEDLEVGLDEGRSLGEVSKMHHSGGQLEAAVTQKIVPCHDHQKVEGNHTQIPDYLHMATMLCKAQSMVLHTGTSTDITEDKHLYGHTVCSRKLPACWTCSMCCIASILRGQAQKDDGEQSGSHESQSEKGLKHVSINWW
jgi:hypothetical protein